MQDQKIEKIAAIAVNITKVLVIIYLGFIEVFKIGKLLREKSYGCYSHWAIAMKYWRDF